MDVVDLFDPVVLLQRDGVKAARLAHRRGRGLELAEDLDGRAGSNDSSWSRTT
jgi:hypothetical protein